MDKLLATLLLAAICIQSVISDRDLQQQNLDQLDPLNDQENLDTSHKDQDKRTIFKQGLSNYAWAKHVALRPSGAKKILGYSPVDLKLTPVLRPVSIKHQGYHYDKPKIRFQLRRPVFQAAIRPTFRPVVPQIVKPSRPTYVDYSNADHINLRPETHVDHVHVRPAIADHVHVHPGHVDQVHTAQHGDHVHTHVDHIHPLPAPQTHLVANHFHALQLPHTHAVGHLNHIHTLPAPIPVPHVHHVVQPFVPSPLFEVTRPDLGVLPLGAVFSSPVLKDVPAPNLAPVLPVHAHAVAAVPPPAHVHPVISTHHTVALQPQPVAHVHPQPAAHAQPVAHFHPQPVAHFHHEQPLAHHIHPQPVTHLQPQHVAHLQPQPVALLQPQTFASVFPQHLQHIHSHLHAHTATQVNSVEPQAAIPHLHAPSYQPGTNVEYHRATNFVNLLQNSAGPQVSVNAGYPSLPNHFHLNFPQIPQHTQHTTSDQGDTQTPTAQPNIFSTQQHPPLEAQPHFQDAGQNVYQQQLPNSQTHFQPESTQPQDNQPHYQPADQVSTQHFYQPLPNGISSHYQPSDQSDNQGYVYQRPDVTNVQQHSIQPGQTDVQLPLHLPHHPNYDNGRQLSQASEINESVFRPSVQLEAPYKK